VLRTPVLRGLLRPKLLLGCDPRLLLLAGVVLLGGIFAWPFFVAGGLVVAFARLVGAISPLFLDEKLIYMRWRLNSWRGVVGDESPVPNPDRGTLRTTRKVTN
jgi:hypothetical protein